MSEPREAPGRTVVPRPRRRAGNTTPPGAAPAGSGAARRRLARLLPGLGSGLLMLVVGSVGATRPGLSWDEVATADVAQRSPAQIWQLIHHVDAVLGAYYVVVHAWTRLAGVSEWDLRAPSILAMAAAVGLAGELGRRLFGPLVGALAGVLLCLLPNTSRYAAEARPYAFSCLLSVLALLLLYAALDRPGGRRWVGYGTVVVLLGLSHVVALTALGAHAVAVGCVAWRRRAAGVVRAWALTVAVALLVLLPVFRLGAGQRDAQLSWVAPVTVARLYAAPADIVGSVQAAWLLVGLALLAGGRRWEHLVPLAALALVPPAAVAAVSRLAQPLWVPRYLLITLAPLALLAAVAVVGGDRPGRGRRLRVLLVLVVLAGAAYPGQRAVRRDTAKNGADYRGIARILQRHQLPGDAVLYEDRSRALRAGIDYYGRGAADRPRDVLVRRSPAEAGDLRGEEHADVAARLAAVRRVWLVVNGRRADPTAGKPGAAAVLGSQFERVGLWHVHAGTVGLYQRRR